MNLVITQLDLFSLRLRESVDNDFKGRTNKGTYATGGKTDSSATASESLLNVRVSPGKQHFIKGYEIEKIAPTNLDLNKARDFNTVNASIATFELGNFTRVDNVYGTPDISQISGESTAYKTVGLFDLILKQEVLLLVIKSVSQGPELSLILCCWTRRRTV